MNFSWSYKYVRSAGHQTFDFWIEYDIASSDPVSLLLALPHPDPDNYRQIPKTASRDGLTGSSVWDNAQASTVDETVTIKHISAWMG